ncbi:MAG: MFS transporter [Actinobacteria bacterium]|uniref:Unannotated protein n=1 Tax=freshwater metagenome TaxID=449393 RepID=A0A6J7TEF8_9ZZZZ|nr:MFS transporter [Actinomycetota bacterium]MSX24570.1 MFS transporter [Actinomycetota bacterium]MSY46847.1 MFS transporter [Actinomycetota bacterium]MSY56955.1 MFS transporter [Actinomycetota bacterium]MTA99909.1 MFS transporter [Actinomycetota bacterium]
MFSPYKRLFKTPGGLAFSTAGFIGRMPISMDSLALIFIVVAASDSYALAGSLAAVASVVVAIALPIWSRWADRYGQGRMLWIAMPLRVGFLSIFIYLVTSHAPIWSWFVSIIAAESAVNNTGGLIRRRWLWALGDDRVLINTAYSYEALLDEFVFILGPVIATACAVSIAPSAGLIAGMIFMVIGVSSLAIQKSTQPPAHPRDNSEPHPPVMRNRSVQAVVISTIFIGGFFNAVAIVVVAFSQEHHAQSSTGVILGIWAFGSGIAAIFNGVIKWKINNAQRFWIFLVSLCALSLPLVFVHSMVFLAIALFFNGFAIAPLIVAAYGVAETAVPPGQITETLAWVVAGMPLGGAAASAISGWVIDHHGAQTAFWVPFGALFGAILMGLTYFRTWNRLRCAS